ncbi:MAG: helix-turn-helix domain-containing protein [Kingella oralis]|jgi:HTH-type transcriptional regulator for conjugative element R391|uniref:helix-turn-helix domain-containing protein n=2 Tax=Kingella TaxID=32257 RepID=UPI00204E10F2|nr:MAG TPA: Repressor protein CI [Caudoviricetes sp.]DAN49144.1 MAG TPA: Repressor protein CI [Caudoviricetes sp.]DAR64567.1 MAG TPA: Repressor protein CI [Caudoviricetes sp.]DAS58463.1 MAG TPA: Repressor protein CI [Caudoviricetes sp.]
MTFAERVKARRIELGLSQAKLGKLAGNVPQSTIGQIENGRNKSTAKIVELAEALQTSVEYLLHGKEEASPPAITNVFDNNVNLALKHILHRIPVISWVQAGCWRGIEHYRDDDLEYIEITTDIKDGFGLRVQGDSMMPEFAQGDIIVVAPHAQPENGSYVVVVQDDKATFKKLVYDGAKPYFKPLNPQYPMLESNENTRIAGVVKQKIKLY